jgi:uncharacterized membrane protein
MTKTATFGVLHLGTSFTVGYLLTGSLTIAGAITFVEPLVNTVLHYFFDKYWGHPGAMGFLAKLKPAAAPALVPVPVPVRIDR